MMDVKEAGESQGRQRVPRLSLPTSAVLLAALAAAVAVVLVTASRRRHLG